MRPAAAVVVVGPLLALVMASASVSGGAAAPPQPQLRAPSAFLPPIRGLFGRRRSQATPTGAVTVRAATVPTDLVEALREAPWRTGLEPAEDCALLEAPTVEGALPKDLVGTLYRNGAGRIRVGERLRYGHWFDGDGFVSAVTLTGDGRCLFRQRYLRGPKLLAQEKAGDARIGPRGVWTQAGGAGGSEGPLLANAGRIPANPVNTNVLVLEQGAKAGKVLALCEGGPPFEIDPVTLALGQPETFGGIQSFFSAHPKVDSDTGVIYNQGVALGPSAKLNIMKISPAGELLLQRALPLPGVSLVHDFVLAGRFVVVFLSPYGTTAQGLFKSLLGLAPLGGTYRWRDDEPTRALVFAKDTLELVHDVPVFPPVSNYHFVNGWERPAQGGEGSGSGSVVEVLVAKHRAPREAVEDQFKDMYHAYFTPELECETWRYAFRVDPAAGVGGGALLEAGPLSLAQSSPGYELPTVNPRVVGKPHRWAYVNSLIRQEGFVDSVSKVDLAAGGRFHTHAASLPEGCFASEAVFVPRARSSASTTAADEEDDGYLLFYKYDRHRGASDLVVLDARDVERPPLAVVRLPVRVPYSYHGAWTPRTFGLEGRRDA